MRKIRQIFAIIGIILLVGMYAATLVLALSKSPDSQRLLMASIYCTIAVPVVLYAMTVAARALKGRGADPDQKSEHPNTSGEKHSPDTSPEETKTERKT